MKYNKLELAIIDAVETMLAKGETEEDISAFLAGFSIGAALSGGITYESYIDMIKDVWEYGEEIKDGKPAETDKRYLN